MNDMSDNSKTVYSVQGMTCGKCAADIKDALSGHVDNVEVSLKSNQVRVSGGLYDDLTQLNALLLEAGNYVFSEKKDVENSPLNRLLVYKPLLMIFALVIAGTYYLNLRQPFGASVDLIMMDFMGLFFVIFSFFKLLNLSGFKDAFSAYDLIAAKLPVYGYVYPFIELGLGISFLMVFMPVVVCAVTIVLMSVGTVGVVLALRRGQVIQCACVGTAFNLPMSLITVVENVVMIAMAMGMLYLNYM